MHHHAKPTHIVLAVLTLECKAHGQHRIIVGGLDEMADMSARILRDRLKVSGRSVEMDIRRIPLDEAYSIIDLGGLDVDDLPY